MLNIFVRNGIIKREKNIACKFMTLISVSYDKKRVKFKTKIGRNAILGIRIVIFIINKK